MVMKILKNISLDLFIQLSQNTSFLYFFFHPILLEFVLYIFELYNFPIFEPRKPVAFCTP